MSRANLLPASAALHRNVSLETKVEDSVLRKRILDEIKKKLFSGYLHINVIVHQGAVELWEKWGRPMKRTHCVLRRN